MPFLKRISNKQSFSTNKQSFSTNKYHFQINYWKLEIGSWKYEDIFFSQTKKVEAGNWKFVKGFSLIEILVVIALFSLTSVAIVVSYLTFERNQRLKNAALTLKSDIRFAQNKALAGDKGAGGICTGSETLVGWYIRAIGGRSDYVIAGDCLGSGGERSFNLRTAFLPRNTSIGNIAFGSNTNVPEANILFRPLSHDVTFHSAMATPDFLDNNGNLQFVLLGGGSELVIALTQSGNNYQVKVNSSGEVNEFKP